MTRLRRGIALVIHGKRCSVRQILQDPAHWVFDFDGAAAGGKGGADVLIDAAQGLASIDGVHKNQFLRRQTGALLAEGLALIGMPQPAILEGYNVEKTTRAVLVQGGTGQGTLIGNLLEDAVRALGGTIARWEPVRDGAIYHLRVRVVYP